MSTEFHIEPAYREPLKSLGLTSFEAILSARVGTPIEVHRTHTVFRLEVTIAGRPRWLLLKRILHASSRLTLRQWRHFQPARTRAMLEARTLARLAAAGIPTLPLAGWGERSVLGWPRQAFLLIETAPGLYPVNQLLDPRSELYPQVSLSDRRQLLRALGDLLRRWHTAALPPVACDLPCVYAPLPLRSDETDPVPLRVGPPAPGPPRNGDALATLQRWVEILPPRVFSRTDLCRVAHALAGGPRAPRTLHRKNLAEAWPDGSAWRKLAVRCAGTAASPAKTTTAHRYGDYLPGRMVKVGHLRIDERYLDLLKSSGLRRVRDVFTWQPAQLIRPDDGRHGMVFDVPGPGGETIRLRLYRFVRPTPSSQFRRLCEGAFTQSTAERLYHLAIHLTSRGLPCALPVAWAGKLLGPWEIGSFILFREPRGEPVNAPPDSLSIPEDLKASLEAAGVVPVNGQADCFLRAAGPEADLAPCWIVHLAGLRRR